MLPRPRLVPNGKACHLRTLDTHPGKLAIMQRTRAVFGWARLWVQTKAGSQAVARNGEGPVQVVPRLPFHSTSGCMTEQGTASSTGQSKWMPRRGPLLLALAASGVFGGALAFAGEQPEEGGVGIPVPPPGPYWALPKVVEGEERKKRIVVLGTGWAAISLLKSLDTDLYEVVVVSPRNYFLFTPLLPGVTAGSVEGRSISEPVRRIIWAKKKKAKYCEAECINIDPVKKTVKCRDTSDIKSLFGSDFEVEYDHLVVGVGAQPNTFNTPGVNEYCHFLKEIGDADRIREHIVDLFETASLPGVPEVEKKRLLRFVIVGGGPTGVEFAAELHDLVLEDLGKLYPDLVGYPSITVIQSGDHILNTFDQRISRFAEKKFSREGVMVKTGCRVISVSEKDIVVKDKWVNKTENVPYGLVVWSTGIGTRPVVANFMEKIGQKDRRALSTDEWLRVKNAPGVYAAGDCASIEQRMMQEDMEYLFKIADVDKSGRLSHEEFEKVLDAMRARYPQIDLYVSRQYMKGMLSDLQHEGGHDKSKHFLDIKEFNERLCLVDKQMKTLPATAQVAAQQGEYLAHCFNHLAKADAKPQGPVRVRGSGRHLCMPFRYKHFGQFAPLGGGEAGVELPGDWVNLGRSTQWLWYSVYASKQVSWRTRSLVVFDWTKRAIFGRDSSRM